MTFASEPNDRVAYRDSFGGTFEAKAVELDEPETSARPPLEARRVRLELPEGNQEVRRLSLARTGANGQGAGYSLLDNEILAGVRLARLNAGRPYPAEVSELVGFEADQAHPFAFLTPLRGDPVGVQAGLMLTGGPRRFQISLLKGVLQLSGAGIAHRGLSPETVLWDGTSVQITDFSLATLIGAPRTVAGTLPWQAPEQRKDHAHGTVSDRDDLWAAGRLIFYVLTGDELDDLTKVKNHPELGPLLEGIFAPPDSRPSARELLRRLGATAPMLRLGTDPAFEQGLEAFKAQRARKHPSTSPRREQPAAPPQQRPVAELPAEEPEPGTRPVLWVWLAVIALLALAGYLAFGR